MVGMVAAVEVMLEDGDLVERWGRVRLLLNSLERLEESLGEQIVKEQSAGLRGPVRFEGR